MTAPNPSCQKLKDLLVEYDGFDRSAHPELAAHVEACTDCQRLLAAWHALPGLLDDLPEHTPEEPLVERVREAVAREPVPAAGSAAGPPGSTPPPRLASRRFIAPSLATAAILLAAVGLSRELLLRESPRAPLPAESQAVDGLSLDEQVRHRSDNGPADDELAFGERKAIGPQEREGAYRQRAGSAGPEPGVASEIAAEEAGGAGEIGNTSGTAGRDARAKEPGASGAGMEFDSPAAPATADFSERPDLDQARDLDVVRKQRQAKEAMRDEAVVHEEWPEHAVPRPAPPSPQGSAREPSTDPSTLPESRIDESVSRSDRLVSTDPGPAPARNEAADPAVAGILAEAEQDQGVVGNRRSAAGPSDGSAPEQPESVEAERFADRYLQAEDEERNRPVADADGGFDSKVKPAAPAVTAPKPAAPPVEPASRESAGRASKVDATPQSDPDGFVRANVFPGEKTRPPVFDLLAHYAITDGLRFQPAGGYWANTHIPGDPAIRLLDARLATADRAGLPPPDALERAVAPYVPPFDAPDGHALSLSLMADVAGVPTPSDGAAAPTRFRLQVGLKGIEHRLGQRPAMSLVAVVDLPPDAADADRIAARALIDALLENRQAGDRFALVVTGDGSGHPGRVIGPDDFRHGTVREARDPIVGAAGAPASGDALSLTAAYRAAADLLATDGRPLGSSAILLISGRPMVGFDSLLGEAHAQAADGIATSVVPLASADPAQADALVLAGLGHRRVLADPADAARLIGDELHAATRTVARAARLSVRLAPGVRLVDVIGSHRLDEPAAQRVRDIENATDRRLAAERGIAADRGRDEDGIQIVIPAIHSGDDVTVLLDLVTDRPGPVAEVSLRYKDLVFGRNGALGAQFDLPIADRTDAGAERGPAERTVLKNLLAHHVAAVLERAAAAVGHGDIAHAAFLLRGVIATMDRARETVPAWSDDPDLAADREILERYRTVLEDLAAQAATGAAIPVDVLTDSLRLAAWIKRHGPPGSN